MITNILVFPSQYEAYGYGGTFPTLTYQTAADVYKGSVTIVGNSVGFIKSAGNVDLSGVVAIFEGFALKKSAVSE